MEPELDRVEAVFSRALEKDNSAERDRFLDQTCGQDAALRARVDALLAAHDSGGSFLSPSHDEPTLLTEPVRESPGAVIGRYKLLEQIGEGGFGVVFMAEQKEPVRRNVALKIIKLGMDTRQVVARFEAERQALAMMDHPHIAKVLDGGATATGRPYFVMELVKGVPITEFCDANKLTPRQRLELFIPICSAIQHAHQKGIIHRDLKPGNVLVTMHDDKPVPKIIDFGVAKAINQRLTESTLFTEFRQLIGTPAYMSPEQAQMSGLDVDTRSDIYSLGVLLYELLAGATPFDATQLRSAAYAEMQRIIREVEPPPPSTKVSTLAAGKLSALADRRKCDPASLSRTLKGELDWIVMKCLEKDRARRYETAGALARDVHRYLSDEPVEASPPSATYRLRKLLHRHRREAIMVMVVMAALVLGLIGTGIGLAQARHNLAQTRQAEQKEADQRRQADAVAALLQSVFSHLDPFAETKGGADLRTQLVSELDKVAADLSKDRTGDPMVRARLLDSVGRTQLQLGEIAKAENLLEAAFDALRLAGGPVDAQGFLILQHVGKARHEAGRTADAIPLLERAREWQASHLGPDHPDTLAAMNELADAYGGAGRKAEEFKLYKEIQDRQTNALNSEAALSATRELALQTGSPADAIKLLENVRDEQIRKLGPEHPEVLNTLRALADKYRDAGRTGEAVKLLEDVRDKELKTLRPDHPEILVTLNDLGLAYGAAGRHADEVAQFERVREMCLKKFGPDHPWVTQANENLAEAYNGVGRTAEAIELLEKVRDSRNQRLGSDHPEFLRTLLSLGLVYRSAGRPNDAVKLLEQVRDSMEKNLGPNHPATLATLWNLFNAYGEAARVPEAVKVYEQLMIRFSQNGGVPLGMWSEAFNIGGYYRLHHRTREAVSLLEQARDQLSKELGPDNFSVLMVLDELAGAYQSEGRLGEAQSATRAVRDALARHSRQKLDSALDQGSQQAAPVVWGRLFAVHGDFRNAADYCAEAVRLDPGQHYNWHEGLMPVLLQLGEFEEFRRRRSEELRRFKRTTDRDVAHRVAKDALSLQIEGEDLKLAVALADRSLAIDPSYWAARETKGMAEYRSGHYEQAVEWFLKIKESKPGAYSHEIADLFLAMCYQRLGDRAKARTTLDRAVHTMAEKLADPDKGQVIDGLPDWVICHVIRREAEGLIGGGAAMRPIASQPASHPAD